MLGVKQKLKISAEAPKSARQLVLLPVPPLAESRGATARALPRHSHMASLAEFDGPRRGWRQIDVTPADKGTAIIDPHRHASTVADVDQRPKRKRAVRRCHCGTVEVLTARSKMTTDMRVKIERCVPVSARIVTELRSLPSWPHGLVLDVSKDPDPRFGVVKVERV